MSSLTVFSEYNLFYNKHTSGELSVPVWVEYNSVIFKKIKPFKIPMAHPTYFEFQFFHPLCGNMNLHFP